MPAFSSADEIARIAHSFDMPKARARSTFSRMPSPDPRMTIACSIVYGITCFGSVRVAVSYRARNALSASGRYRSRNVT